LFIHNFVKIIGCFMPNQTRHCPNIMQACASGERIKLRYLVTMLGVWLILLAPNSSWGADPQLATPFFTIGLDNAEQSMAPTVTLQIFLLMTVLSIAPAILIMVTSFTRIVIVLSLLRYHANAAESGHDRAGFVFDLFYHDSGLAKNQPKCFAAIPG